MVSKLRDKNRFSQTLYIHSSYMGTFSIPCKIINRNTDNKTLIIEYLDPVEKEIRKKWVLKTSVIE